jgi:hypothetical protein
MEQLKSAEVQKENSNIKSAMQEWLAKHVSLSLSLVLSLSLSFSLVLSRSLSFSLSLVRHTHTHTLSHTHTHTHAFQTASIGIMNAKIEALQKDLDAEKAASVGLHSRFRV